MSLARKKSETCEEQLRRMCKNIAESISSPGDGDTAHDWMESTYDIRYLVSSAVDITGLKSQASSNKHQAPRHKHQASSHKQQAPGPRPLHKVSSSPKPGSRQV